MFEIPTDYAPARNCLPIELIFRLLRPWQDSSPLTGHAARLWIGSTPDTSAGPSWLPHGIWIPTRTLVGPPRAGSYIARGFTSLATFHLPPSTHRLSLTSPVVPLSDLHFDVGKSLFYLAGLIHGRIAPDGLSRPQPAPRERAAPRQPRLGADHPC